MATPEETRAEDVGADRMPPWEVFAIHMALPSIARLVREAERKELLGAEDLEACRRALSPEGLKGGDVFGWAEGVREVKRMLEAAHRLGKATAPEHDQGEEPGAD